MRRPMRTIVAVANPAGRADALERVLGTLSDTEQTALVVLGSLTARGQAEEYRAVLRTLGHANLPAFYVPGARDVPLHDYLREAYNIEISFPFLHGVHGSFAVGPGYVVVAGMGGLIDDRADATRDEQDTLRYAGWEVEYRFKMLHDLKDYPRLFLFTTPPAHKGMHETGSQTLAELINTYHPQAVFTTGGPPRQERLGTTSVVFVGELAEGYYTVYDRITNTSEVRRWESTPSAGA